MQTIVQKYGGTSVGSAERIKEIAKRVLQARETNQRIVVVVSAMGKTTNNLISLSKEISPTPCAREYDALISTGENVSAALLAMAIQEHGIPAISLTGYQAGIITENKYSKAKIIDVNTERLEKELNEGKVVVITGFQGINNAQDVTTIGRGGSDTSAVVLAAALKSPVCEIYTDVDGIYTTDPRIVKNARKIPEMAYDEILELATLGAKVLHPRAIECAKHNNINIHVRSSFNDSLGTIVKEDSHMEINRNVTGAALLDETVVTIKGVPDQPGIAGVLFSKLAEESINIDMIVQSADANHVNTITFTVLDDELGRAQTITEQVAKEIGAAEVVIDEHVTKLSIVGVGMISQPGVAARFFDILGKNSINIKLISTSEIKISCAIDREVSHQALQLVHDEFGLDAI